VVFVKNETPGKRNTAMAITAQPLTPEAFAPFGQVLMAAGTGGAERYEFAASMDNLRADAKTNMTFIKSVVKEGPVMVGAMEKHEFSNQTFVPLNGTHYLVAVCPTAADGGPDTAAMQVFVATGAQAVNYGVDVWHAPNTVLTEPCEFVMLRHDDGSPVDTETRQLETPIEVDIGDLAG
jgi:ureidoglycolate lyase